MSDALANLDSNLSGDSGGTGLYSNQVFLGREKVPASTTVSPTGVTYKIPARKKDATVTVQEANAKYLTDEKLRNSWLQTLRANGMPTDPLKARALWEISVAGASDWYATSNGTQKITPQQYLGWYAGGQKKKTPALPTRQIYQVSPEQIESDINEFMTKRAGRTLTDEDKNMGWYQDLAKGISELYGQGTVTTTKEVRNPKTGKMEKVVTQTPGFSKQQIEERIVSTIEAEDPASVERKRRIDNTKWLLSRGGQG